MRPIMFHNIPHDRKGDIAHTQGVCEVRPTEADPNRTRVTIGGNTINYLATAVLKQAPSKPSNWSLTAHSQLQMLSI